MQVYEKGESFYVRLDMLDTLEVRYHISELEFEGVETEGIDYNPDYWTRLEHQAAITAMGGMCGNMKYNDYAFVDMAKLAIKAAHALVEKMKNKEE